MIVDSSGGSVATDATVFVRFLDSRIAIHAAAPVGYNAGSK